MRARRGTIVALVANVVACAPAPPPVEPAPPEPPVVTAALSAAPPEPPPTATAVASSAPAAPPTPSYGPPPKPPMAMRWSFHMSRHAGHGSTTMRLSIDEEGNGTYEREDEESGADRCHARVAPELHKKAVEAARGVVTGGCAKGPPKRETPQVSVEITYAGKTSSCAANRDGPRYGTLQTMLDAVQEAICR
jgi:hypothetical protein